jgi:3-deoxy-D-manno-octulosonic-acid transferase
MTRRLYTLVLSLALLALCPLLPFLMLWPRLRRGLLQRLGLQPRELRERMYVGEGSLWVHAASLGEVNAVAPAMQSLVARLGGVPLLFTCTSLAGLDQAKKLFPDAAAHVLMPFDLPLFLAPLFRRYRPRFAVLAETELWPNFLSLLHGAKCQVLLANGRMSEKSFRRYERFRALFAPALLCFDALAVQSDDDAERFIALGAKTSRVVVTGNTKFDVGEAARAAKKRGERLREELGLKEGAPLIVAGSTRPGEEAMLLKAFKALKSEFKGLSLLLAPRHQERFGEVEGLISRAGLKGSRRSRGAATGEVILLDTLGELGAAYSFATLAWIGGSWAPFGGQNPLEAAAQAIPVLFGPDMRHFKEPARVLLAGGAALQLEASDLPGATRLLLSDPARREAMGAAGRAVLKAASGASLRTADLAWKLAVLARLRESEHDWRNQSAFASLKVSEFGHTVRAGR